jgi:hypothetical protein
MRLSHLFIRRPIFAGVIAVIITIVGAFAYFGCRLSQYPDVVPPTVTVSASYPGASAEPSPTPCRTDRAADQRRRRHALHVEPVDGRRAADDHGHLRGRHRPRHRPGAGPEPRRAREPSLPEEVRRTGVVVRKTSPNWLMA